jgi:RNA-directed DNA polymerase
VNRLSTFLANHHQRNRRFGWWAVARQSADQLGLIDLNGIIVPPQPLQPRHRAH